MSPETQRRSSKNARQTGAALVELAIAATLILLLMFAIIDFGRIAYAYHFVSEAAREATRWGAVRGATYTGSCATVQSFKCEAAAGQYQTFVESILPSGFNVCNLAGTSSPCSSGAGYLHVSPSYPGTSVTGSACTEINNGDVESPSCAVQVTVQYTYGFTLPFMPNSTITMSSTSEMLISQ